MKRLPILVLGLALASGCVTPQPQGIDPAAAREAQLREDLRELQAELRRSQARIEAQDSEIAFVRNELTTLRRETPTQLRGQVAPLETRLNQIEARLTALQETQARDKQEIVASLSQRIADIMAQQARATGGGRTAAGGVSATGREHTVEAGQTLSDIARAYGTTVNAIVQANNLPSPDRIRVGQKLFIPD